MTPIITIPQDVDTPARREITPNAIFTYLYDRSRDSRQGNALGQDFIAYGYRDGRIAFAVCDGVSQSFYGDLAARFLGERLTTWLLEADLMAGDTFAAAVDEQLRAWVADATALIDAKQVNPDLPPMVRDALDKKRANGSESMFVGGVIDLARQQIGLCWMGDMRLWLFDARGEAVELPGAAWETRERWSSRVGPKNGAPRTARLPLTSIARIIVHSDGVGSHAPKLPLLSLAALDTLVDELDAAPASDDISVLDISLQPATDVDKTPLGVPVPTQPDPTESVIRWEPIPGAGWYRVEVEGGAKGPQIAEVTGPTYLLPSVDGDALICRVQALASNRFAGAHSAPITVTTTKPSPVVVSPPSKPAEPPVQRVEPLEEPLAPREGEFRVRAVMWLSLVMAFALSLTWFATNLVR